MGKVNLFISYSHLDKAGLDELLRSVNKTYCRDIDVWQDGKLLMGEQWHDEIGVSLITADIILLLLSPDFLQSKYINEHELTVAFDRHKKGAVTIIPIFYRPCNFLPLADQPLISAITRLQGCASNEAPLTSLPPDKKDVCYANLQNRLNDIALQKKIDVESQQPNNSPQAQQAREIQKLKSANKIFVSVSAFALTNSNRKKFIKNVESKASRDKDNWNYTVVPSADEVDEFFDSNEETQAEQLRSWMEESIYHIHIAGNKDDLSSSQFSKQYQLSKQTKSQILLWYLDPSLRDEAKTISEALWPELSKLPTVDTKDYEAVFQRIKEFDMAKQQTITNLSAEFATEKKIFMFYDYTNDNKNDLRRKLRMKIQENPKIILRDPPEEVYSNQVEGVRQCQGAIIFYGRNSDSLWFRKKEQIIQDAGNIVAKAVCLDGDENEIEEKIQTDVSTNEFVPIKGAPGLADGVQQFQSKLQDKQ